MNTYNNWGLSLFLLKKYEESRIKYKKAIKVDPNFWYAHYGHGNCLSMLGRKKEAIENFKRAVNIDPNIPVYCNWGNDLYALGELKKQ